MLLPKKVKFRKQQRGNNRGIAVRGSTISFGEYAIKSIERGLLTSRQLEAARKQIVHETKRGGKIWIRVFPDKPIAKKPPETRMGSGKGEIPRDEVDSVRGDRETELGICAQSNDPSCEGIFPEVETH